jgi:CheY-like chemotaxis protein
LLAIRESAFVQPTRRSQIRELQRRRAAVGGTECHARHGNPHRVRPSVTALTRLASLAHRLHGPSLALEGPGMSDWDGEITRDSYERPVAEATPSRKKVLLVDDSETVLMVEKLVLGRGPYDIVIARNGEEALERAVTDSPDLILLDVVMPRMNGFEVCRRLRALHATRAIPIIFVTTRSNGEDVEKGFRLGGNEYIKKPFSSAELLAKLRAHLGE